jgi:hypothetical protein
MLGHPEEEEQMREKGRSTYQAKQTIDAAMEATAARARPRRHQARPGHATASATAPSMA